MERTKISHDNKDVYVSCPHCGNCEGHPVDEQRHHLQNFDILGWHEDHPETNEVSVTKCVVCEKEFELEWDYNNVFEGEQVVKDPDTWTTSELFEYAWDNELVPEDATFEDWMHNRTDLIQMVRDHESNN